MRALNKYEGHGVRADKRSRLNALKRGNEPDSLRHWGKFKVIGWVCL
jgi:hypothetical protein